MIERIDIDRLRRSKEFEEGRRHRRYKCTQGFWTIGIGRNLDQVGFSTEEIAYLRRNDPDRDLTDPVLSDEEIEFLFANDVNRVLGEMYRTFDWFAFIESARRKEAMLDMLFQLGLTKFRKFKKMLAAAECGEWDTAHDEALDSRWAKQTPQRAHRVATALRDG